MPKKMAMVDFNKCRPEQCLDAACPAAKACKRRLLKQEKPGEVPMPDPGLCRGCADCLRACPLGAIQIVNM
jgi:translation initiation factor RLI1